VESEETGMDLRALHRHGWSISALARRFRDDPSRPRLPSTGLRAIRTSRRVLQPPLPAAGAHRDHGTPQAGARCRWSNCIRRLTHGAQRVPAARPSLLARASERSAQSRS
jgi:hypothetical protein